MLLKSSLFVTVSLTSFISVFYSAGKLMFFLSVPSKISNKQSDSIIFSLLSNMILLTMFMLQHTFMVLPVFRNYLVSLKLQVISRSIYNLLSALSILVLVTYWITIKDFVIWNIDTNNTIVWYTFVAIHLFAWSVIYTGCLFMDMSEILGVKQVYYDLRNMPDPMDFKSAQLQRLYGHTRHPSFSAFSVIFWANPIMSLDRLFLALVLTAYMYIAWKTDKYDLHYQANQYVKKNRELSRLQ